MIVRFLALVIFVSSFTCFAQETDSISVKNLNEIVVKATRAGENSGMAFTTVTKSAIEKNNVGQDLPTLLNFQPSIVTTSDAGTGIGYSGIRIRGSDATRINVSVNGIPFNDAESQGVYWVNMPDLSSSIQNIQIQRGVGTSNNGAGAFGGSINVNTMGYSAKPVAQLNSSYGSFNTQKINLITSSGLFKKYWIADLRLFSILSDGFVDRSNANLKSLYGSLGYYRNSNFVRFNVISGKEITHQAWEGIPQSLADGNLNGLRNYIDRNFYDEDYLNTLLNAGRRFNVYTYPNQVDHYTQTHYQLISSFDLKNDWRFSPSLHYTKGKGYFEQYREGDNLADYGFPDFNTNLIRRKWLDNDFYGVVYNLEKKFSQKLSLILGGAANNYIGDHFGEIIHTDEGNLLPGSRWYQGQGKKSDVNVYLKNEYTHNENWHAFVDLQVRQTKIKIGGIDDNRIPLSTNEDYLFFNPKLGITFNQNETLSYYGSFSVGNKEPSRQDFVDNPGSYPVHERLDDFELGLKYRSPKFLGEITSYFMDYKNQLVLTGNINNVGDPIRQNVANSYRAGLELQSLFIFNPKWNWQLNATFSSNKIKNFIEVIPNYGDGENQNIQHQNTDIAFSPNFTAGSLVNYLPIQGLNVQWQSKFVSKQFLDNTSNIDRSLAAYWVNNLNISYALQHELFKDLVFTGLLNNFLNAKYESNGYTYSYTYGTTITENFVYPQAGINFILGIKIGI